MNFSIVKLYFGKRAKIYTIQFEKNELDEYNLFVFDNMYKVPDAVRILDKQLRLISEKYGIIEHQFKRESSESHNVFRITETNDWLRLYCIKYSRVAIIVGGGGIKDKNKVKLKDNPELLAARDLLIKVENTINKSILSGETKLTDEGIEGKLNFCL